MRRIIALAVLLASPTAAHGQQSRDLQADYAKMMRCIPVASTLIGLSSAALLSKCGILYRSNTTITAYGKSEQLVFGHGSYIGMYVYVDNGIVTAVQVPSR